MPNPAWITSENVKFNGTLDNAAVLKTAANIRSLILWDDLSADDQTILTTFIDNNGGALPLAGPTAGVQYIDFKKSVIGTTATGLNNVAAATAGKATINIGGNKVGGDPTGLSTNAGTAGFQVANFLPTITGGTLTGLLPTSGKQSATFSVAKTGASATGLALDTAGYQIVNVGGAKTGVSATGFANDATTYTASIDVDGGAHVRAVSIVGSAAQTYADLITELNNDSGAWYTAALVDGNVKITSNQTGATSAIAITDTDLFSTLTGYVAILAAVAGTSTTYTTTITVDGVAKPISIVGQAAQTFTDLITEINTDLGASAVAAVVNGGITVTSTTTTPTSTVLMVTGTLFPALTNFSAITAAIPGTGSTTALTATINVDGVNKAISVLPANITTFTNLITEINTDLGAAATASISGGDIKITSATTGVNSTVDITAGTLFPALPGFNNLLIPQDGGGASRQYSATVVVDGVIKSVKFTGLAGNTITNLISEINTDLGASATAALTGGNIVITSATTGLSSSVKIDDNGFLFNSLTGYAGISYTASTAPINYTATITVDGVAKAISVKGSSAQTFTDLITEINTDLGAAATASLAPTAISGKQSVNFSVAKNGAAATGLANDATAYTATITVDGVAKSISVVGSAAQTFTDLVSEINTDLGVSATAAVTGGGITVTSASNGIASKVRIVSTGVHPLFSTLTNYSAIGTAVDGIGNDILITSATTGVASKVSIKDGTLFKAVGAKGLKAPVDGIADMVAAAKLQKTPAGTTIFDHFNVSVVGLKPKLPTTPATLPKTQAYTYFDGTVWKYLVDDTNVNP